jgi:precorrin-2/cobalt-factor-2 C20-methyltransferase
MKSESQSHDSTPGKLYGVGAGPGAADLLTLRAERVIQSCHVICLPASARGRSYAGSIIENLIDHSRQEILLVQFPMLRNPEQARPARERAAEQVLERLYAGQDVAFVTEGDPLLYSTFGYVLETVKWHHPTIPIEIVPGVSSITAAASAACLPLAAWDERIAIIPAAYALTHSEPDDLRTLLKSFDTIVLLKVNKIFNALLDILHELDLTQNAVFVQRCSTDVEEVIFDLERLRDQPLDYFSLVIVRKPNAISHT